MTGSANGFVVCQTENRHSKGCRSSDMPTGDPNLLKPVVCAVVGDDTDGGPVGGPVAADRGRVVTARAVPAHPVPALRSQ